MWPGISVTLTAYGKQVEKVFTVQPGAVPDAIRVRVAGAQGLAVADDGALVAHTGVGDVRLTPPVAFQEIAGTRRTVPATYVIAGDEYGFHVSGYDPTRPVAIDPLLQATFLGGSSVDESFDIAIAPTSGDVYVAGLTDSINFPGTGGGAQRLSSGGEDAFVARLDASLTALDQATYLGGSSIDQVLALAIAPTTGDVYVAGVTESPNFPGTSGGAQRTLGGPGVVNGFVARLNPSLTSLEQATYLGGSNSDAAIALAIAPATGKVYVSGLSVSPDFPGTSGGAQAASGGVIDAFVARLNAGLTTLEQATYFGGSDNDEAIALAIAPATGDVYITGFADSPDLPGTRGGAQSTFGGGLMGDGFVARLNGNLTALEQATYLGGNDQDQGQALAIAPATGDVYVAGHTASRDFPGTTGSAQSAIGGVLDGFVARLNAGLTTLDQATYLGGVGSDEVLAIRATVTDVYVAGNTRSANFPGTPGGAQSVFGGDLDGFVARLNPGLTALRQSTFLGGPIVDSALALAIAPTTGDVYVAGFTASNGFPGIAGGAQSALAGDQDAFVARLSADLSETPTTTHHDEHDDDSPHDDVDHDDSDRDDDHHEHELLDDVSFDHHDELDDDDDSSQHVPRRPGLLEDPSVGVAGRDARSWQSDVHGKRAVDGVADADRAQPSRREPDPRPSVECGEAQPRERVRSDDHRDDRGRRGPPARAVRWQAALRRQAVLGSWSFDGRRWPRARQLQPRPSGPDVRPIF